MRQARKWLEGDEFQALWLASSWVVAAAAVPLKSGDLCKQRWLSELISTSRPAELDAMQLSKKTITSWQLGRTVGRVFLSNLPISQWGPAARLAGPASSRALAGQAFVCRAGPPRWMGALASKWLGLIYYRGRSLELGRKPAQVWRLSRARAPNIVSRAVYQVTMSGRVRGENCLGRATSRVCCSRSRSCQGGPFVRGPDS